MGVSSGEKEEAQEQEGEEDSDDTDPEYERERQKHKEAKMKDTAHKAHEWNRQHENQNTRRTYDSALKQFEEWCEKYRFREDMIDEACVARYLQWMVSVKDAAASTIGVAVTAIKDKYKYEDSHITNSVLVKSTLKIVNTMAKKKTSKKPLTLKMMQSIVEEWASKPSHTFAQTRDVFLILLMMAAFLRESEAIALTMDDVKIETVEINGKTRQVMLVHVKKAKNDQERKGHTIMLSESINHSKLCPVTWYERYVRMRAHKEAKQSAYLFVTHDDKPFAKTTPSGILKKAVMSIGMDPTQYGSHSARIGGTTEASKSGVATLLLKRHGNWKSDVVYDYIRQSAEEQLSVTEFLDC